LRGRAPPARSKALQQKGVNLAGILLVVWMLVVGFTGVINTWDDLVIKVWQFGKLAEMTSYFSHQTD
jgi:cytochrome b561